MKLYKRLYKNQESRKWKGPNEQSSNEKRKGSSKGEKVECFNYGILGHYAQDCPILKYAKKSMQVTWSDIDSEESASIASENARYDPNDLLAFIASKESGHDSDCDSDDDEFIDEQRVELLSNLVVEHDKLIKSYMKRNDILDAHKNKIDVLNVEKTNFLEKIRLLEFEHHSLLEKNNVLTQEIKNNKPSSSINEKFHLGTKVLNEILDKYKTHGDKRGLGYINKDKTPYSGETRFFKGKDNTPNQVQSPKKTSPCTHYNKTGHSQFKCYTRFLKRFETQKNRLINDFNFLKNNILNNEKGNKTNKKPRSQSSSSKSPPKTKWDWLRNDRPKCQVVSNALKVKPSSKWYLDSGFFGHMIGDKSSFTFLKIMMVGLLLLYMEV